MLREQKIKTTGLPTRYRTRHFFYNSNTNKDIATKQTHTTDTFLFISHTMNVLLFKFRSNIFIGVRIIKEMPGSVASGTTCTKQTYNTVFYVLLTVSLGIIFVNNQLDAQFFFMYVYFYYLHVSGSHVPIIRRINCINTISGIRHSEKKRII